jgi:DNA-binding winged helix-turn-helix (wHTH) protein
MPVHFRVLGPVEAEIDGARVDLGHARQRCVLAVLLVEAGRVVPVDALLDRVWAGRLPRKARVTLSGYVSRLRRLLATGEVGLTREADGYRLAVDPMTVDLYRFRELLTRARADRDAALFAEALVVVTSRDQLTSLVAGRCAHPLTLDLLTTEEARELLASRVGAARVAAEPAAVDEIITACARLPLALTIAAARATTHPHFPLHTLAAELRDSHGRLDAFADTDPRTDIRAVFSWSYRALSADAARLFRLLGPHPGPDVTVPAAASLTALPLAGVRPLLTELTRAHLLTEHLPGRYTCHDLLRTYANERADTTDTAAERHDATHRLLDHYLHTALAATHVIDPYQGNPVGLVPAQAGVVLEEFADKEQAVAWLTTEHQVLLAAINHAAHHGFETYTWSLAWALSEYSYRKGHWFELGTAFLTALRAAERVAAVYGDMGH